MGLIISKKGEKKDESDVRAINEMDKPTNKKDVRRLFGWFFLFKFIPNVWKVTAALRRLLKSNLNFQWSLKQDEAFINTKKLINSAPVLKVFSSSKEIIFQAIAENKG